MIYLFDDSRLLEDICATEALYMHPLVLVIKFAWNFSSYNKYCRLKTFCGCAFLVRYELTTNFILHG